MVELSEYDIQYQSRTTIKAHALTDFLAEIPNPVLIDSEIEEDSQSLWQIFVDGSAWAEGNGIEILLVSPSREEMWITIRLGFKVTNNEVEYEAILSGLQAARAAGAT